MGTTLWAKSGGQSPDVCKKQVAVAEDLCGGGGGVKETTELHFPAGHRVQVPSALGIFPLID